MEDQSLSPTGPNLQAVPMHTEMGTKIKAAMADRGVIVSPALCKACEGKCCKSMPGCAAPEDFGATKEERIENVKKALRSGNWQLDKWEGVAELPVSKRRMLDPYFIRPRPLDGRTGVFNYTWGGKCVFLGLIGCEMVLERRPYECRLLEPMPGGSQNCKAHYASKLTTAEMWLDAGIDLEVLGNDVQDERDLWHSGKRGPDGEWYPPDPV